MFLGYDEVYAFESRDKMMFGVTDCAKLDYKRNRFHEYGM